MSNFVLNFKLKNSQAKITKYGTAYYFWLADFNFLIDFKFKFR
jgi:hypothetical protein